jgi:hypothetical protein
MYTGGAAEPGLVLLDTVPSVAPSDTDDDWADPKHPHASNATPAANADAASL